MIGAELIGMLTKQTTLFARLKSFAKQVVRKQGNDAAIE